EYLLWQYSNSKIAGGAKQLVEHNDDGTLKYGTQENPLELEYNGEAFSFSIAKTKAELQSLGVKLASYSGNTSATSYKDGLYCAKVTMSAYSTKYYYTTTTYEFYYKINRVKVDLSGVKWAYSSPFTYDGSAKSIYLDAASIPTGLAVKQYIGNGQVNATEGQTNADGSALKYTTRVVFTVVNDSYYLPDENDTNSYINGTNGKTFSWTCDWEINKATVYVKWTSGNYNVEGEGVYKVPVLKDGASLVNYTYQTLQEDGSWVDGIQKIPHTEASCNVTASLKDEYTRNYNLLVNTEAHPNPVEFKIGKDQVPVQVGAEVNGVLITEGEGGVTSNLFPYTGSAYVAVPVVLGGDLTVNDYTVTYFTPPSIN
ncbi:MAG: hypothetical protein K2L87_05090, partial [Clostridiales bacterium]|nr:hypothetical protein [Clostridiales bacterium]